MRTQQLWCTSRSACFNKTGPISSLATKLLCVLSFLRFQFKLQIHWNSFCVSPYVLEHIQLLLLLLSLLATDHNAMVVFMHRNSTLNWSLCMFINRHRRCSHVSPLMKSSMPTHPYSNVLRQKIILHYILLLLTVDEILDI